MHDVYLASSWRNPYYDETLAFLRDYDLRVFSFRETNASFRWDKVAADHGIESWDADKLQYMFSLPDIQKAYENDLFGIIDATAVVLVHPCGKSSHVELGLGIGFGKPTAIFYDNPEDPVDPDLMILPAQQISGREKLLEWLRHICHDSRLASKDRHASSHALPHSIVQGFSRDPNAQAREDIRKDREN